MKPIFFLLLLSVLLYVTGCLRTPFHTTAPDPANTFFVATNGNDQWSGRLASPNYKRTDGPFATLQHALESVRQLRHTSSSAPSTIYLRGGSYFLNETLSFGPEDSHLTLAAFRNERPVLSAGRRIGGWNETTVAGKKLWAAPVSEVRDGRWFFRELWVNGHRATRARHPNQGYLNVESLPDAVATRQEGQ